MNTLEDIERAIEGLNPGDMAALQVWLNNRRDQAAKQGKLSVIEQGLGMFSSPEDAAMMDDIVKIIYEERRRPSKRSDTL